MAIKTVKNPSSHFVGILRRQEFLAAQKEVGTRLATITPLNYSLRDAQGKLIAGVSGKKFGNTLEIDLIFTDETLRKQGIGADLMAFVNQWAVQKKCDVISLWCTDWHAHGFWENQGLNLYGKIVGQPVGHEVYYFAKPVDYATALKPKRDFVKESPAFYDELLPYMQSYEQKVIPHSWPEDAVAFQMKKDKQVLAKTFGFTIWNYFYCDGLWVSNKATDAQRVRFATGLQKACKKAGFDGVRLVVYPWQSPEAFAKAGFDTIEAPMPNPNANFARQAFYKSGLQGPI